MRYLFANWKMYLGPSQTMALASEIAGVSLPKECTVAVFPSLLSASQTMWVLKDSAVSVGVQDVFWTPQGAYTGAVSALFAKEAGAAYALCGHSERRYAFGDTDEDVRKKVEACVDAGLTAVLCVGETAEDATDGKGEYRVKKQLQKALEGLDISGGQLVVAYEPVWAISQGGAGEPCPPEKAAHMHAVIKAQLGGYTSTPVPVLYGGSVKKESASSYLSSDFAAQIDGLLVGHAATSAHEFEAILAGFSLS